MAAIENLEIIVDVDISSALVALQDLQDELVELGADIEALDQMGTEGIDVRTTVDQSTAEFAALQAKISALDGQTIDVDTDFDRGRFVIPNFQQSGQRAGAEALGEGMEWLFGDRRDRTLFKRVRMQASELADTFDEFDLRMSDLHNLMARFVPLLIVFIGVIPAAVTALVGLAAAAVAAAGSLAAIAGLGALGLGMQDGQFNMERLTEAMEEIRDDFMEAFGPLAEALQPLFEDALDGLERFFNTIAAQGDVLMQLTDNARAFGRWLNGFMPELLRGMGALFEGLSGILGSLAEFIDREFVNIMRDLTELTARATPAIADFLLRLGRAIPAIVEFSIGMTQVANAILVVFGAMADLLGMLGLSQRAFGGLVGILLTTITVLTLANAAMGTFAAQVITGAVASIFAFWESLMMANSALTFLNQTAIARALVGLKSLIVSVITGQTSFIGLASSIFSATGALAAFMTIATLGGAALLVGMAVTAAAEFLGLAGSIDTATESLKDFNRVSADTGGPGFNPYGQGTRGAQAADATATGGSTTSGSGGVVVNVESSGDPEEDRSNARYSAWRVGRTTGGGR